MISRRDFLKLIGIVPVVLETSNSPNKPVSVGPPVVSSTWTGFEKWVEIDGEWYVRWFKGA